MAMYNVIIAFTDYETDIEADDENHAAKLAMEQLNYKSWFPSPYVADIQPLAEEETIDG